MMFVAAIWGVFSGIFSPLVVMGNEVVPTYIPLLWMITAVVGFVSPCFFIKFRCYKTAVSLVILGTISLIIMHILLMGYASSGIAWLYMPLLVQTVAVVLIPVMVHRDEIIRKRYEKKYACAPSILGGVYELDEKSQKTKTGRRK